MAGMGDSYRLMKATFRRFMDEDLTDAQIASRAPGRVGDDYYPYALFCWGDEQFRIWRDGSYEASPGPFDEEYEALERELDAKGLLYIL